jgi:hypothetical protein
MSEIPITNRKKTFVVKPIINENKSPKSDNARLIGLINDGLFITKLGKIEKGLRTKYETGYAWKSRYVYEAFFKGKEIKSQKSGFLTASLAIKNLLERTEEWKSSQA